MKVLAMVLAGGQGSRLDPLTAERSKPAVPWREFPPLRCDIMEITTSAKCC